jgi:hypothetical protein
MLSAIGLFVILGALPFKAMWVAFAAAIFTLRPDGNDIWLQSAIC